jgi:hypothetical protein
LRRQFEHYGRTLRSQHPSSNIHVDALDLSLPDLMKEKADLQKQTTLLEEEGRKSGADSGLVALIMFRAILPAIGSSSGYW